MFSFHRQIEKSRNPLHLLCHENGSLNGILSICPAHENGKIHAQSESGRLNKAPIKSQSGFRIVHLVSSAERGGVSFTRHGYLLKSEDVGAVIPIQGTAHNCAVNHKQISNAFDIL